jgi:hypothetical protein
MRAQSNPTRGRHSHALTLRGRRRDNAVDGDEKTARRAWGWIPMRFGWTVACTMLLATAGCPSSEMSDVNISPTATRPAESSSNTTTNREADWVDSAEYPGRVHVVQSGDTLFSLAERYYGNGNQWRRILQANQRRLTNPRDLPVGMKLIIP